MSKIRQASQQSPKGATKPIRELAIDVKIERLAGDRRALHDLAFDGEHGAAARDLFWPSLSRSAPPRSVAMLASTSRNSTRDFEPRVTVDE